MMIPNNTDVESKITEVSMPWPHMQIRLIKAPTIIFPANRGGFKTSLGMAPFAEECAYEFPRGSGVIVGPTFEHLYDNTLNALVKGLTDIGFVDGIHFVVRVKPPDDWPKPFINIATKKYDNLMTWHNGYTDHLVSLARLGSTNALSVTNGKFDEAKLLDESTLMSEVFPIFRPFKGMPAKWKMSSLLYAKFFSTDKLAPPNKINWILEKRKLNNPVKNQVIMTLQMALNVLNDEYNASGKNKKRELRPQINRLEVRLYNLRKNLTLYIEADHNDTQVIQGPEWYKDKVDILKPYELKIAIHNEDPTRPEDGFYPDYDPDVHGYRNLKDYDSNKPFIISLDYQHSVSPMPICQISRLPGAEVESLNYIDELSTLAPQGLEDAVQEFCDRYKTHNKKRIYYIYDQTATGKRNDAVQYYKIVLRTLRKNRWNVVSIYTGQAPEHFDKYNDTKAWLQADTTEMPIRINLDKCVFLDISIKGAEAITRKKGNTLVTRKQKKYEDSAAYPKLDQRTTTHFSDCFDMTNHAVIKKKKIKNGGGMGGGSFGTR